MAGSLTWVGAQEGAVALDADDIGGVVTSANGLEAGVWVIAETTDLPTRLARIVVTDDAGRYVVPDLPDASYEVFVRGYGLLDSERVAARPGHTLDLNGRVDDPDAGWKGKGYWASFSTYATWHIEGGRGEGGVGVLLKAVKFQVRPDPLAK